MPTELPSIASLQAFVAVAGTLSFKQAALELHLSASALSRQVTALEEHLGALLFQRLNPGLELTAEGSLYLGVVGACLGELERAQQRIGRARVGPLRVSALESFCENWLIPHLPEFERLHPNIELHLETSVRYADFERDAVDVALRFGVGPWPELHSEPLLDLTMFCVCSPALLGSGARGRASTGDAEPQLREPADLAQHTLIHVSQTPDAWARYLSALGHAGLTPRRQLTFDRAALALSAAENGLGVALSTHILCAKRLEDGRLCRPFECAVPTPLTYHFVCRPSALSDPRVVALRDWLVDSLSEHEAAAHARTAHAPAK